MSSLTGVLVSGPLSIFASGFREDLARRGYRPGTAAKQLQLMAHLSRWLAAHDPEPAALRGVEIERFVQERRASHVHLASAYALEPLLGYLRGLGAAPPAGSREAPTPARGLLDRYAETYGHVDIAANPRRTHMPRVIAVSSQKGGIGKTTMAANLAVAWSEQRAPLPARRPRFPQFALTRRFGIAPADAPATAFELLAGSGSLRDAAVPVGPRLDLLAGHRHLAKLELSLAGEHHREEFVGDLLQAEAEGYDLVLIDCPKSRLFAGALRAGRPLAGVRAGVNERQRTPPLAGVHSPASPPGRVTAALSNLPEPR